jgi:cytochrome c-type biogenesis protein CcmE
MTKRQNRMVLVALLIAGAILAVTLLFQALGNNSNYFYSPTEVAQGKAPIDRSFRLIIISLTQREFCSLTNTSSRARINTKAPYKNLKAKLININLS